jgi:diguanylate cyclase (GGDEF)-like protein
MELTLWRWSLGVQILSLSLILAFFLALQRSLPRDAIASWVNGWVFNFMALGTALGYWLLEPAPGWRAVAFFLFIAFKTLAVLYIVQGAWSLHRPRMRLVGAPQLVVAGMVFPLFGAWAFTSIGLLGTGQQLFLGLMFVPTGIALLRSRDPALRWLAAGFVVRGGIALVESFAYASQLLPDSLLPPDLGRSIGIFLAVHSSLDSGADWLLALGFVLAISLRAQRSLQNSIEELRLTQGDLRRLVDHDPLTALLNRRALPGILRAAQPEGATLLFFDLDDFKLINDRHGHVEGDRCLQQFARVLKECFRPDDSFVRYGGDEFLVIAVGLDRPLADGRVDELRRRLASGEKTEPALRFSVGVSHLAPGARPEDALREADRLMYAAKADGSVV